MKHYFYTVLFLLLTSLSAVAADKKDPSELLWDILENAGTPNKPTPELKKHIDQTIIIDGWIIPNEYDKSELVSFLLAHYPKGCIHVPLPPPESVIEVIMTPKSKKLKDITSSTKVRVEGTLVAGSRVDTTYKIIASSVKTIPL